jgi:hypothetical protein
LPFLSALHDNHPFEYIGTSNPFVSFDMMAISSSVLSLSSSIQSGGESSSAA